MGHNLFAVANWNWHVSDFIWFFLVKLKSAYDLCFVILSTWDLPVLRNALARNFSIRHVNLLDRQNFFSIGGFVLFSHYDSLKQLEHQPTRADIFCQSGWKYFVRHYWLTIYNDRDLLILDLRSHGHLLRNGVTFANKNNIFFSRFVIFVFFLFKHSWASW